MTHTPTQQKGALLILVLIFGAIFVTILTGFIGYIVSQNQLATQRTLRAEALRIAESGFEYYRWFLAHNPGDITNGTGVPGPYVMPYTDPEDGIIGEYSLQVGSNMACGDVTAVDITSTGYTHTDSDIKRTVYGRYAKPTIAEYAMITNGNIWYGNSEHVIGPLHSNHGIHMDGTNSSIVTSSVTTWHCPKMLGCGTGGRIEPGIFGTGPNNTLWSFPVPMVDFAGITVDLAAMQTKAQSTGVYIPPSGGAGYLVDFRGNGTFDLYRVTDTRSYDAQTTYSYGWVSRDDIIKTKTFLRNISVPSDCSLIFIEDKVWLEGSIDDKVTLAVADTDTTGTDPSIVLEGNITYTDSDAGFLAIAENDVTVGVTVPNNMYVEGIFVAQKGAFQRDYLAWSQLPSGYKSYYMRNSFNFTGTVVTNKTFTVTWVGGASVTSGFPINNMSYDRDLADSPPPLTPTLSDNYEITEWREVE